MISLKKHSLVFLGCLMIALTACAAPSSYMGISFKPGVSPAEMQWLAQQAMSGDKQAQLDLGIRFEEGLGVERNVHKARKLYVEAATETGGAMWAYSPPVGNNSSGRVIPIALRPMAQGLAEAKQRLENLDRTMRGNSQ